jgi:hypothetical protein
VDAFDRQLLERGGEEGKRGDRLHDYERQENEKYAQS